MKFARVFSLIAVLAGLGFAAGCASTGSSSNRSLADLQTAATGGDASAAMELGDAYYYGKKGAAQDYTEAEKWYKQAAAGFNTGN